MERLTKSQMHDYQNRANKHIIENSHCALFMEMGLGKTVSTLTAVQFLIWEDLEIDTVLVVAPKRVVESVWEEEKNKWDHLKHLKVSKIIGNPKQRIEAIRKKADVYLISRDNLAWLVSQYGNSRLPFQMLVLDELSSFKNPKSVRFKSLKRVQPFFRRVVGLTGTPAPNGMLDLWSQIYLLDRGDRLGKYITHYRNEYFIPGKRNGNIVYSYKLKEGALEEINDQISDICISMKSKDYLDLPERIENVIRVKPSPDLKDQYEDFEKEQVLSLFENDTEISAINAAALYSKLLQFSNGAIYDEHKNYHVVHDLKIEALKEIVDNYPNKSILIGWTFRHDLFRIKEALKKYNPRELKTNKDIEDWNAGKIKILAMHPASGGHGLNLQKGGHIIVWFGQTNALELEQQFNARLDRQGQTFPVIINRLILEGSLEEKVILSQKNKEEVQESLMQAVKVRIQKYLK